MSLPDSLTHLTLSEKADVLALVERFPALFRDVPSQTTVQEHDIDVGSTAPIKQHPYRVNPTKCDLLKREVTCMLANSIAKPSSSAWSFPCLLVNKPDGTYHFCTDYHRVNAVTKSDRYPLIRMDDCVDRVGSAKFASKFDLLKGYWQVPLTHHAQEISALVTPDAFFGYNVMAFGMRNAPATFQRLVNVVLAGMPSCEAYLDDIVLYNNSWPDGASQIRELFRWLTKANLTINLAKCELGKATVVMGEGLWGEGRYVL